MPVPDGRASTPARRLAAALEPFVAQVYFSPECHAAYAGLGFNASPGTSNNVALPDGAAYFTSRGSVMGQVAGDVVAAAFAVFNPAVVVPAVTYGWSLTDAVTICAARDAGAVAQLRRLLGDRPEGLDRANELLGRAIADLNVTGRPLFAGVRSLGLPDDPLARAWRAGDQLREYRGDSHTIAWVSAGLDATEIGLLTELLWGLPLKTYIRTRAWSADQLEAGIERLRSKGLLDGDGFSPAGAALREEIEAATDAQLEPVVQALGDDLDELVTILAGWSRTIRHGGGYPSSPGDLLRVG
jgi:hypothetical protein